MHFVPLGGVLAQRTYDREKLGVFATIGNILAYMPYYSPTMLDTLMFHPTPPCLVCWDDSFGFILSHP